MYKNLRFRAVTYAALMAVIALPNAVAQDAAQAVTPIPVEQPQAVVDPLEAQAQAALKEYQTTTKQIAELRAYNDHLEHLVSGQREELQSVQRQSGTVQITNRKIAPLMVRMVEVLDEFFKLDTPFLLDERKARLAGLKKVIDSADVDLPEKYRRVLEAYQVEVDYGRTIEAYTGERKLDGRVQAVNFLRIGRVALFYASLDGNECGYWDSLAGEWKALPKSFNRSVNQGLRVARNEIPPDLIELPISAPHPVQ